jgi:hypothetical protein
MMEIQLGNPPRLVDERRREDELADIVLGYLAEHPDASDTLEGIAEWWIMRQQTRVEVTTLARVLRRLSESSLLEKIEEGDTLRYRLNVNTRGLHS